MDRYYYELVLTTDEQIDLFESHLLDLSGEAIERRGNQLILRSEQDPTPYETSLHEYAKALEEIFAQPLHYHITISQEENEDWIQKYKEGFTPFELGSFYVRATWHEALSGLKDIAIDPDLSFGTGHHPTTRVCLLAIEKYIKPGDTFLDVGCGSGILSIAAARMGAVVSLCDIEENAVKNAAHNLSVNDVAAEGIWEGSVQDAPHSYDVVVANIVSDILIYLKKDLIAHTKPGGYVILSGILEKYETKVRQMYTSMQFIDRIAEGDWVSLIYRKEDQ